MFATYRQRLQVGRRFHIQQVYSYVRTVGGPHLSLSLTSWTLTPGVSGTQDKCAPHPCTRQQRAGSGRYHCAVGEKRTRVL